MRARLFFKFRDWAKEASNKVQKNSHRLERKKTILNKSEMIGEDRKRFYKLSFIELVWGLVHTSAFSLSSKAHRIDSCPHYCFDAFSTVYNKTFESDRIARCDVSWTLCACYEHIRLRYFQSSLFLSTVHTYMICMHFRFDPRTRAFSNRFVFAKNAQCIEYVDGRP